MVNTTNLIAEAIAKGKIKEVNNLTVKKLPHVRDLRTWNIQFKKDVALGSGRPEEACLH